MVADGMAKTVATRVNEEGKGWDDIEAELVMHGFQAVDASFHSVVSL